MFFHSAGELKAARTLPWRAALPAGKRAVKPKSEDDAEGCGAESSVLLKATASQWARWHVPSKGFEYGFAPPWRTGAGSPGALQPSSECAG